MQLKCIECYLSVNTTDFFNEFVWKKSWIISIAKWSAAKFYAIPGKEFQSAKRSRCVRAKSTIYLQFLSAKLRFSASLWITSYKLAFHYDNGACERESVEETSRNKKDLKEKFVWNLLTSFSRQFVLLFQQILYFYNFRLFRKQSY